MRSCFHENRRTVKANCRTIEAPTGSASGNLFGGTLYVMIVVTDDASTVTPTPTSTVEGDDTSTPTNTSVVSTSTPTHTAVADTSTSTCTAVPNPNTPASTTESAHSEDDGSSDGSDEG